MSLDEYLAMCFEYRDDPAVHGLVELVRAWKGDVADVDALARRVERYFGNTWIADQSAHDKLYRAWTRFKESAIDTIGGQTMNERLYYFSLFDRFDAIEADDERKRIYTKLKASISASTE